MNILELPDELLLEIFKPLFCSTDPIASSVSDYETRRRWHAPDGAVLPKVSRRFYRLAMPGLYTHLDINADQFPLNAACLHRTLSENPELRAYCRSLRLALPDNSKLVPAPGNNPPIRLLQETYHVETEIVSWLTNVKHLSVAGHFHRPQTEKATWDLVRAAGQHMPKLGKLTLGEQVGLETLCEVLGELKHLHTLEIGIGVTMATTAVGTHYTHVISCPTAEQVGSSTVTSLSIEYLLAANGNLARLLLVPARIEHFALKGIPHRCYFTGPLADLKLALEPHKSTLRTLHVASARASGIHDVDPSLEDEVKDLDWSGFTELKGIKFIAAPAQRC